jgi:LD-carboxypeptidase N-terminal domain
MSFSCALVRGVPRACWPVKDLCSGYDGVAGPAAVGRPPQSRRPGGGCTIPRCPPGRSRVPLAVSCGRPGRSPGAGKLVRGRGPVCWDELVVPELCVPAKLAAGGYVAVVSPLFAAPGRFSAVHEIAMRRLREEFGLVPVEYPATRQLGASPEARAPDLAAAFADRQIGAVLATIGGGDQLAVLPLPDTELFAASPQAFIGYSDNTSLLNWLWNLGIAGYHGGSAMVHLGRPGACTRFPLRGAVRHRRPAAPPGGSLQRG